MSEVRTEASERHEGPPGPARSTEPLIVRIGGRRPVGHLLSALALLAVVVLSYLLARWADGAAGAPSAHPSLFASVHWAFVPGIGLLAGLVVSGSAYVSRGLTRDLDALRGSLTLGRAAREEARRSLTTVPVRRWLLAAAVGILIGAAAGEAVDGRFHRLVTPGYWGPLDAWAILLIGFAGLTVAEAALLLGSGAGLFHRLARFHTRVDLLDLEPLEPYGRAAVRAVLPLTLVVATVVITGGVLPVAVFVLFIALFLAIALRLAGCLLALRTVIRRAKAAEMERIGRALHGEREALRTSPYGESLDGASFAELLVYRSSIEGAREWIMDGSEVLRFVLYVLIPAGSWVASVFLERAAEAWLGG